MSNLSQTDFSQAAETETPDLTHSSAPQPGDNYFFESSGARLEMVLKCPKNNPYLLLGPTPEPFFKIYIRGHIEEIVEELTGKLHDSGMVDGEFDPVIYLHGAEGSNWFSKLGAGAVNPDGSASGGSLETIDKIVNKVKEMISRADLDGALTAPKRSEPHLRAAG